MKELTADAKRQG